MTWAQFVLKFIVSHPAVSCAIPATTRVDHVQENMGAALGRLPDEAMRARMVAYVQGSDVRVVDLLAVGLPAFLPTYLYRLFELYNLAIWPTQLAALALGAAILVC